MKHQVLIKILVIIVLINFIDAAKAKKSFKLNRWVESYKRKSNIKTSSTATTTKKLSIVGGVAANPGQFPYQVLLIIEKSDGYYRCGAVLIYLNYALTAAHCLKDAIDLQLIIGEYDLTTFYPNTRSPSRIRIFAKQWVYHESYNETTLQNDIGLIHLPLSVVLNKNISTIPISLVDANKYYVDKTVQVSGWGARSDSDEELSNHLLYTNVKIINTATCLDTWDFIDSNIICTVPPTNSMVQSSCGGDSGGPLTYIGALIGIVSFGSVSCEAVNPSGYTAVAPFYNWILKKVTDANLGKFWPYIPPVVN